MKNTRRIIGFGELGVDKMYDEDLNLMKVEGGDCVWNILYNLGLMGENCYAVGCVGKDEDGEIALDSLRKVGIDTTHVKLDETKPTNAVNSISRPNKSGGRDVEFSIYSPITNERTFNLSQRMPTQVPEEFNDGNSIVAVMHLDPQYKEFFDGIKDKKVVMDFGHEWILDDRSPEYVKDFLSSVNVCQINGNVLRPLCKKLGVSSLKELSELLGSELLIVTDGVNCVHFAYRDEDGVQVIKKQPQFVVDDKHLVDSSGAGDTFFSVFIKAYRNYLDRGKAIDEEFIEKTFPLANAFSSKVIQEQGCRVGPMTFAKALLMVGRAKGINYNVVPRAEVPKLKSHKVELKPETKSTKPRNKPRR